MNRFPPLTAEELFSPKRRRLSRRAGGAQPCAARNRASAVHHPGGLLELFLSEHRQRAGSIPGLACTLEPFFDDKQSRARQHFQCGREDFLLFCPTVTGLIGMFPGATEGTSMCRNPRPRVNCGTCSSWTLGLGFVGGYRQPCRLSSRRSSLARLSSRRWAQSHFPGNDLVPGNFQQALVSSSS